LETHKPGEDTPVSVILNGTPLAQIQRAETELFPVVAERNGSCLEIALYK